MREYRQPFPFGIEYGSYQRDAATQISKIFFEMGLNPEYVPQGRVDGLGGGFTCINLKNLKGIEAAVIVTSLSSNTNIGVSSLKFRVEYAIRGTIRHLLPNRIIAICDCKMRGIIRKKLKEVTWRTPSISSKVQTSGLQYYRPEESNISPGLGEVWNGGPYRLLVENLNKDDSLTKLIREFMDNQELKSIHVVTDPLGESIRITTGTTYNLSLCLKVYTSQRYLQIADQVLLHLKAIRKIFGGLTF